MTRVNGTIAEPTSTRPIGIRAGALKELQDRHIEDADP